MGAKDGDNELEEFLQKFNATLNLLKEFCSKPKASFSENVSFLLDKALDHLEKEEGDNEKLRQGDAAHLALIRSRNLKEFFSETLKTSRATVIHPPIIIFAIKLFTELTSNEARFQAMSEESSSVFPMVQQLTETTIVENSEIKQVLLSLFLNLSKFRSGQQWLWRSGSLAFIADSLSDRTIFTRKTAQELMNLILPIMEQDQRKAILVELLGPVVQAGNKLDHRQIESDKLRPYFEVLENYMEQCLSVKNHSELTGGELSSFEVERALLNLAQTAENEKLLSQAGSLLGAIYANRASRSPKYEQGSYEEKTMKLIKLILRRGFPRSTLSVTSQSLFFWSQLDSAKDFQVQLVCIMVNNSFYISMYFKRLFIVNHFNFSDGSGHDG